MSTAPDLQLKITWAPEHKTLSYELSSPAGDYHYKPLGSVELRAPPREVLQATFYRLSTLAKPLLRERLPQETTQATDELARIGQNLYYELFPLDFKREYLALRKKYWGANLQITTDDPWIPWEIVRPFEADGTYEDPPLCESFQLTRWIAGAPPLARVTVSKAVVVQPEPGLPAARIERNYFAALPAVYPILAVAAPLTTVVDTLASFRAAQTQLYHFACHGNFDLIDPNDSVLKLNDDYLTPSQIVGNVMHGLRRAHPLVFINSCHSGERGIGLTRLGGWAERFIDAGASAFIGPLWDVNDELAARFAVEFYDRLFGLAGHAPMPLAEAFSTARLVLKNLDPANSTWLAYVLYGNPTSKIDDGITGAPADTADAGADLPRKLPPSVVSGKDLYKVVRYALVLAGDNGITEKEIVGEPLYLSSSVQDRLQELESSPSVTRQADKYWWVGERRSILKELIETICADIKSWKTGSAWDKNAILGRLLIHDTQEEGAKVIGGVAERILADANQDLNVQAIQNLEDMLDRIRDEELAEDAHRSKARSCHRQNAVRNVLSLLRALKSNDLSTEDLSHLSVKDLDFRQTFLRDTYARATRFAGCTFRRTFGSISSLAVSPDGKLVAMGANNGEISLWNSPQLDRVVFSTAGKGHHADSTKHLDERGSEKRHEKTVRSLKFVNFEGDDDLWLLSAGDDGMVLKWRIGEKVSPTPLVIFDLRTPKDPHIRALCASVSPNNEWVLVGDDRGQLHYRNHESGLMRTADEVQCDDWLVSAEFLVRSPGQPLPWILVTGSQDGTMKLWHVNRSGAELEFREQKCRETWWKQEAPPARLRTIIPDPHGRFFLVADENSAITLFRADYASGQSGLTVERTRAAQDPSWGRVWGLALSPGATHLASGTDDGKLRLWSVADLMEPGSESPKPIAVGAGHTDRVWSVAFLDEEHIVTGGDDQLVCRWDLATREGTPKWLPDKKMEGYSNRIWAVAAFPKGESDLEDTLVYAGDFEDVSAGGNPLVHRLGVYHRRNTHLKLGLGEGIAGEQLPTGRVEAVTWHPDGTRLAVASHGDRIILLEHSTDTSTSKILPYSAIDVGSDWPYCAAWHPGESECLAYGTRRGKVMLWNLMGSRVSEEIVLATRLGSKPVRSVAFSHNGKVLAAATEGGQIQCWARTLAGYKAFASQVILEKDKAKPVRALAFYPRGWEWGYVLVSGDDSKSIRLWHVSPTGQTMKPLAEYRSADSENTDPRYHSDRIRVIAFGRDEKVMVSGDDDGKVIVWRAEVAGGGLELHSLGVLRPRSAEREAEERNRPLPPTHRSHVRSLSFFADGDLATCCESEEQSAIVWSYRCSGTSLPEEEGTRASSLFDFDIRRVFHARRLYEKLDYTRATFQPDGTEDRVPVAEQLRAMGAIEAEKNYRNDVQQQMRRSIRDAVLQLYGESKAGEATWCSSTADTIIEEMRCYLGRNKRSNESHADWEYNLDDYRRRLRVLLNEQRWDFRIVRYAQEEEDAARFLLRLCFVLRLKAKNKAAEEKEKLLRIEEILLSDNRSDLSKADTSHPLWSSNYYNWPFSWATIRPDSPDDLSEMSEIWKDQFGKKFSEHFLARGTPFEPEYRRPDYREFFDGATCVTLVHPSDRNRPSIEIACSTEHEEVLDLDKVEIVMPTDETRKEFESSDPLLRKNQVWLKTELRKNHLGEVEDAYDNLKARVRKIDGRVDSLKLALQPVRYSFYCVTNLPISLGMRCVGSGSVLDQVCPAGGDGLRKLPELETCQLGNHLGVDCIVITRDGYLLMYRRLPNEMTDPSTIGFVPSIAMSYYPTESDREALKESEVQCYLDSRSHELRHTPHSAIVPAIKRELGLSLKEMHAHRTIARRLLYLGTFREWARGGKPEMYFITRSTLLREEHQAKLPPPKESQKQYAPHELQISGEFKLCPGEFSSGLAPLDVRRRLWELMNIRNEALQESAKAGIYLLSKAYETAPNRLSDFFSQFEEQG